jgi:protein SCO1/2
MADYVKASGRISWGLTGSPEAIAAAAKAYRVAFAKGETKEISRRLQRRSFGSGLPHGPDGKYVTHFSYGTGADELAEKLNKIL